MFFAAVSRIRWLPSEDICEKLHQFLVFDNSLLHRGATCVPVAFLAAVFSLLVTILRAFFYFLSNRIEVFTSQDLCILLSGWLEFLICSLLCAEDVANGEFMLEFMMNL